MVVRSEPGRADFTPPLPCYVPRPDPPTRDPDNDRIIEPLLGAYAEGVFPMAEPPRDGRPGEVYWYDPDPRGVIPLDDGALRVSRSLRRRLRSGRFTITTDRAFSAVIRACAAPRADEPETWIDDRIIHAYEALHAAGHAHSVEAWLTPDADTEQSEASDPPPVNQAARLPEPTLVGGLYGVHLRGLFAGESMFSRPHLGGADASKVCLVHLWHHLRARGFTLLDTQFTTPHLESLGGIEISRNEYHARLAEAMACDTAWLPFTPEHR